MTHSNIQETPEINTLLINLKSSIGNIAVYLNDIATQAIPSQEFKNTVKTIERRLVPSQHQSPYYIGTYIANQQSMIQTSSESEEVTNTVSIPSVSYYPDESIGLLKVKITQFFHESIYKAWGATYPNENYYGFEAFMNRQLPSLAISINLLLSKTPILHNQQSGIDSVLVVENFHARLHEFLNDACQNIVTNILEYRQKEIGIIRLNHQLGFLDQNFKAIQQQNAKINSELQDALRKSLELRSKLVELTQIQEQKQQDFDRSQSEMVNLIAQHTQEIVDLKVKYEQELNDFKATFQERKEISLEAGSDGEAQKTSSNDLQSTDQFTESKLSEWLPSQDQDSDQQEQTSSQSTDQFTKSKLSEWLPSQDQDSDQQEQTSSQSKDQLTKSKLSEGSAAKEQVTDQNSQGPNKLLNTPKSALEVIYNDHPSNDFQRRVLELLHESRANQELMAKSLKESHESEYSLKFQSRSSQTERPEPEVQEELTALTSNQGIIDHPDGSPNQTALQISVSPDLAASGIESPSPVQARDDKVSKFIKSCHKKFGNAFLTESSNTEPEIFYIIFLDINKNPFEFHELPFNDESKRDQLYNELIRYTNDRDKNIAFKDLKKMILRSSYIDQPQSFVEIDPSYAGGYLESFAKCYELIGDMENHAQQRHHFVNQDTPTSSPRGSGAHNVSEVSAGNLRD